MAKEFITIKIRKSTHEKIKKTLRAGRNKYGEDLTLAAWITKVVEAGLAALAKKK